MTYVLTFAAGFIVGLATWLLWLALRFAADVKAAREAVADRYLDMSAAAQQEYVYAG